MRKHLFCYKYSQAKECTTFWIRTKKNCKDKNGHLSYCLSCNQGNLKGESAVAVILLSRIEGEFSLLSLPSNSPVLQYERPRVVALTSSTCVDRTTEIITEFTCKDPFLHLKRAN